MKTSLQSFYWVASAQDNPGNPAFHIDVLDEAETMEEVAALGGVAQRVRQLNVADALAEGFTLEVVGTAINNNTARELAEAQAWISGEQGRTEQAKQEAVQEAVSLALERAKRASGEAESRLRETIDELRYELEALKETTKSPQAKPAS